MHDANNRKMLCFFFPEKGLGSVCVFPVFVLFNLTSCEKFLFSCFNFYISSLVCVCILFYCLMDKQGYKPLEAILLLTIDECMIRDMYISRILNFDDCIIM